MSSIHDCTLVPWSIAIVRRRENGHDLPGGHEQHWRLSDHSGQSGGLHQVQYGSTWFNDVQWCSMMFNDIQKSLPKNRFQNTVHGPNWSPPWLVDAHVRWGSTRWIGWTSLAKDWLVVEPPVGWKTSSVWNHLKPFETTIPLSNDYYDYCFNQNFCACGLLPNVAWVYCSASWMASPTWHFLYLHFWPLSNSWRVAYH